jgi:nitroreductase
MSSKPATTSVPVHGLIAHRWSGRAYDAARPVARPVIQALLEAARWAPSCYGDEPWRFIVCDRHTHPAAWQKAYDCLAEGNQIWAKDAPVLMLVLADSVFRHNSQPNRWAPYDTGAAAMSLSLEAVNHGLMVHPMGGFDPDRVKREFQVPDTFVPMAALSVGYAAAWATLPPDILAREQAPRSRRPLAENFFENTWGEGFGE